MGTLPRTRSLSGADTSTLTRNFKLNERSRPASLCEASWNRISGSSGALQDRLKRTPSQANNLCTTVPTSIVNKTLGGRHTPTRNSLRHSRMAVMARNAKGTNEGYSYRTWHNQKEYSRATHLVIFTYILVGGIGSLLALWLLRWVPFLPFKEVPHYSSGMVIISGTFAAVLVCFIKQRKKIAQFLKILIMSLLFGTIICCACVCVFDTLHLINLAPTECQDKNDVVIQHATTQPPGKIPESLPVPLTDTKNLEIHSQNYTVEDEYEEGSGVLNEDQTFDDEDDYAVSNGLEIETTPLTSFEPSINHDIYVNVSMCVCHRRKQGWRVVMEYPRLSCDDVKNILPIFLVASCVVMVVAAVLSAVIIYILWTSRQMPYGSYGLNKPSEARPFIFKSNFKNNSNKPLNNMIPTNGQNPTR